MSKAAFLLFPIWALGHVIADTNNFLTPVSKPKQMQIDGPYVLYKQDKIYIKYVSDNDGMKTARIDSFSIADKEKVSLSVNTDEPGKLFTVKIKSRLEVEKSDYHNVKKMLVISDIEGEFRAFRKLLQANGVIDKDFKWTFGNGHLILTGDFFDRGEAVTQVLWLIYSLEEKAKQAGGYVHFILGNHEIMNLSGDVRYVHPKYFEAATLLGEDYMFLYGNQSELGKWLRTKNIIEKVGSILFMHGGISSEVNELNLSSSRLNKTARPYYDDTTFKYPDYKAALLYSDLGPFWYRGYYTTVPGIIQNRIDSTLNIFGARYVATGHTVIADTISSLFNGKLFNTDVRHHSGHSEALLFEDNSFYRVDGVGQKFMIAE